VALGEEASWAVVNEAKSHDIDCQKMVDEFGVVEAAEMLLAQAQEALEAGVKGDQVTAILDMGKSLSERASSLGPRAGQVPDVDLEARSESDPTPERKAAEQMVADAGLPVPQDPDGEPPALPRDLEGLSDREVRKYHGIYNAYFTRVLWLIGLERADADSAERLADWYRSKALASSPAVDDKGDKVPQGVRMADADQDDDAQLWRKRAVQHKANLHLLYSLKDAYAANIERLSRDWTMRQQEYERSGGAR